MVQITQICKFLFLSLLFVILSKGSKADDLTNQYGNYLSWNFAKNSNDINNLKIFFKNIDLKSIDNTLLEEIFFESVILDDWNKAKVISDILLKRDSNNFTANIYRFFLGFSNNEDVDKYLNKIQSKYLDLNFIKAIMIWKNYDRDSSDVRNNDCVPVVCLHEALFLTIKEKEDEAQFFYNNLENQKISSYRIKELLLLNSMNFNKKSANEILTQLNNHNLNIKKHNLNYLKKNSHLLNPIENEIHGMAEVLYNISSWFFSKNLYKYSAFFGKISLKLRPEFNAMKLLLSGTFEKLNYENLGMKFVKETDTDNIYYYKFLRIKLSLFENLEMNKEYIYSLEETIKNYPERDELKILLADKLRRLEKFDQAIKIYSELINNNNYESNSNIFYSRGISYERINEWRKAEKDLIKALKLNPEDAYILNYLAYSWLDRETNIAKALELLKKAVEIKPTDAYIIDSLGWAFFLANKTDESIYFLEKAVSILPDDATLNDHLGDAYWKAGRINEALSQWKRVLILDPKFKKKKLIYKKIKQGL